MESLDKPESSTARAYRVSARLSTLASLVVAFSVVIGSAEAATARYASPGGTGSACTQAAPCSLQTAIDGASAGDDVFIAGNQGDYRLGGPIEINTGIHLHGQNGRPRLIFSSGGLWLRTATADGLYVQADSAITAFRLYSSSADRMIVKSGATGHACYLQGVTLTNSVCWAGAAGDLAIETDSANTLRNVTAVGGTVAALKAFGREDCGCSAATDTLVNVIARSGPGGADFQVTSEDGVSMTIEARHSNYATTRLSGSGAPSQTRVNGDATNQTAPPVFADAANGDFHQAPGSPTVDSGVNDAANGPTDLDGDARVLNGTTDIGADGVPPPPPFPGAVLERQVVVVHGSTAPVKVGCPAGTAGACSGTLTLTATAAGKRFAAGKATFTVPPGKTATVAVKLTARARGLLQPGKTLKTTASALARDGTGASKTTMATVTLKRR